MPSPVPPSDVASSQNYREALRSFLTTAGVVGGVGGAGVVGYNLLRKDGPSQQSRKLRQQLGQTPTPDFVLPVKTSSVAPRVNPAGSLTSMSVAKAGLPLGLLTGAIGLQRLNNHFNTIRRKHDEESAKQQFEGSVQGLFKAASESSSLNESLDTLYDAQVKKAGDWLDTAASAPGAAFNYVKAMPGEVTGWAADKVTGLVGDVVGAGVDKVTGATSNLVGSGYEALRDSLTSRDGWAKSPVSSYAGYYAAPALAASFYAANRALSKKRNDELANQVIRERGKDPFAEPIVGSAG